MTSFNRCESTLRSLAALTRQQRAADFALQVFLVDDGSTDGTADAVQSAFPEIRVLQGDGTLFWNGGMRMAFAAALQESFDAYVLLNDDTVLYNGAIARLVACAQMRVETERPIIAVGSTVSPQTGEHTYGGIMKHVHGAVIRFEKIPPHECLPISCDAMNGNVVLIPREIANVVGNLDKRFRHQFGDLDYALARQTCRLSGDGGPRLSWRVRVKFQGRNLARLFTALEEAVEALVIAQGDSGEGVVPLYKPPLWLACNVLCILALCADLRIEHAVARRSWRYSPRVASCILIARNWRRFLTAIE